MKYQTDAKRGFIFISKDQVSYSRNRIEQTLCCFLFISITPIVIFNSLIAFLKNDAVFLFIEKTDALGRKVIMHNFTHGVMKKSALLLDIIHGQVSFCGISMSHSLTPSVQQKILTKYRTIPGVFSLFDLHQSTGLSVANEEQLLLKQLNNNFLQRQCLLIKSVLCLCLYRRNEKVLLSTDKLPLFGLNIDNSTIQEAADWATHSVKAKTPNIAFYVNAHSINLAIKTPSFLNILQQSDALFADGSGMRIAAKTAGYKLKGNNNGTDMLPHICANCVEHNKSLFLLGANPGTAEQAAKNLRKQHPKLNIAGVQHGYINKENTSALIGEINQSGCDILLVALGSPLQESWLLTHRSALQCQTALAVGGLFDFYSGHIARAPMWLRELGFEWLWRLMQEPKTKFIRYVIGNPLFLFRIYCLGLASKGVK
jgi:N-acetylglucosaminyldiphosphoundecaprenol N-acetyl-beta-D-mannosaminyltransferase